LKSSANFGSFEDAVGDALLAAGAEILIDVPGLALDLDVKLPT